MTVLIIWLALSILAGTIALGKGRSFYSFLGLAFFLSPLVGILAAVFAKPAEEEIEKRKIASGIYRKCYHCRELVRRDARVCRFCGRKLTDEYVPGELEEDTIEPRA